MKAIILCAGRGTRLQPLTDTTPKTLLEVKGKPILDHILHELPNDITEVFLIVDYLADIIEKHVEEKVYPFSISCVQQIADKKGTLAALLSVKDYLKDGERFLILNGDDLVKKCDLEKLIAYDRSFAVQKTIMPRYYKVTTKDGLLESFDPQNEEEKIAGVSIATGSYVLDTKIFDFEPRLLTGNEIGIPQTILDNKDIYPTHVVEFDSWVPINSKEDLDKVNNI
jgi:NDP-sugar pyrophosphorylase family protein